MVFTKVIVNRIRTAFDSHQPKEQAGFRKGNLTTDHIHIISQFTEKSAEYNQPLSVAFIGYEKASDSIETSAVMQALRNQGVEEPYTKILQDIYSHFSAPIGGATA